MKFTILIIDDEKEMCVSLSEILTANGFESRFTTDPLKAFSIIKSNPIDLIILDIKMPALKGIDLLKSLKAH